MKQMCFAGSLASFHHLDEEYQMVALLDKEGGRLLWGTVIEPDSSACQALMNSLSID